MTDGVKSYRDLKAWQRAMDWTEAVYEATSHWPRDERFGLVSQVRRAAVSAPSNLAEGAARQTTGEFVQFIGMARGSLAESETQLILASRFDYTPESDTTALLGGSEKISRMIVALIGSLRRRQTT